VVEIIESKDCFDAEGNPVTLDEAKVATELAKLQAEWNNKDYARKRKVEYAKLNQFELISDDSINGTTNHRDAILAIKDKYPKG
jgi:hypothetical protein